MSTQRRALFPMLLALLVAAVGCGDDPLGLSIRGTFSISGSRSPPEDYQPTFVVQGGSGTAGLNGNFWGSQCGRRLVPEFFRNEDQLTFRLTFVPIEDVACPAVLRVTDYEAAFQTVPAGDYGIQVIYDSANMAEPLRFDAGMVSVR